MYGLITKISAALGQRDALLVVLTQSTAQMPGCLSYVVASDAADADGLWVTEVWDNAESHKASLQLPSVQQAITRAHPLIAGLGPRYETVPVGGVGLAAQ